MKKETLLLLLSVSLYTANAQQGYSVATVPDTLKNGASVITHLENITVQVESLDLATLKVQKIFTVLNPEGNYALFFHEYSSKAIALEEAEIRVYDQQGKGIGRHKKRDMTTVSVGDGLIEDGYVTYYQVKPPSYPVTVEVTYEQKFRTTLSFPDYRYIGPKEAVVESNYTAKVPADIVLRHKDRHRSLAPVITEEGKYKVYKWTVKNLPSLRDEEGSVEGGEKFPYVNIVTDQFSHYGYKGNLSSWKSFGAWISDLYKGLDELPADRQLFFQGLVKDASSEEEKIKRIYEYMQQNFRYVSIQLGIGGLKPFSAAFTDQKKYGDCKGLSNFMKAALKAVGLKSHVAIINADYNGEPVDPDFPANNFNHAILCVPMQKDSVWLECTSNTSEFGQLGTATENRNALLVTEEGGVLVPTPKSSAAANTLFTRTVVKMEADLSASTETTITAMGDLREMMGELLKNKKDDQKELLVSYLGYKQPDAFELAGTGAADSRHTTLKMWISKLPEFNAGSKYFISPRINKLWTKKLPPAENRKLDYYFRFPFEMRDTTILKLVAGTEPDVLPAEKKLSNSYGYYAAKYWYNKEEHAIYTATALTLKKHKVLAADYPGVKAFFDEVAQDDAQKIVVKGTGSNSGEKKAF